VIARLKRAAKRRQKRERVRLYFIGAHTLDMQVAWLDGFVTMPLRLKNFYTRVDRRGMRMIGNIVPPAPARPAAPVQPPPRDGDAWTITGREFSFRDDILSLLSPSDSSLPES
jgi:hypothetical protein